MESMIRELWQLLLMVVVVRCPPPLGRFGAGERTFLYGVLVDLILLCKLLWIKLIDLIVRGERGE